MVLGHVSWASSRTPSLERLIAVLVFLEVDFCFVVEIDLEADDCLLLGVRCKKFETLHEKPGAQDRYDESIIGAGVRIHG